MSKAQAFDHLGENLKIDHIHVNELKPYKNNSRTHSSGQIQQIARSIRTFGFTNPILIDGDKNVIAGHARIEGAKLVGLEKVPTIRLDYLTESQQKAYVIADNKLAEKAGWDMELLKSEMEYITILEIDFDLTLTGFEMAEIDILLLDGDEAVPEPDIPALPVKPVSRLGDLWHLGSHRVLCADATEDASYEVLMSSSKARLVFTDPPYNVPINGHVCGNGKIKHNEFKMASGEMSEAEFTDFLDRVFNHLRSHSANGSLHYICMDWRHMRELMGAGKQYDEFKNLCVWNKTNGGMGSLYRSKHELVFVYKNGKNPHINNIELGKNGRYRTNVWDYAGVNTFQNNDDLKMHPTVKPVAMIQDAILDCSKHGDIVLDVFGGSGSTLLAAEKCNRTAHLMELDPHYVDIIIRRYIDMTGKTVLHEDGKTFEQKMEERHVGL